MRIHHLNCGTHAPLGGALFDGSSRGLFADIVTHCLLIETPSGLTLVDTGYGLQDVRDRRARLARLWPAILNVQLDERLTAVRQVEALGFSRRDVRDVVLTHLDFDHAGGIEDFPDARIHVLALERDAAERTRRSFVRNQRYRPRQWDDVRNWQTYGPDGEDWFGFSAVRRLTGLPPEILMVPLAGHTAGHAGVAIQTGSGWLLHAGDAYLHRFQMRPICPCCPWGLALYQRIMDDDSGRRSENQQRLRALKARTELGVQVFCSHDTEEFTQLARLRR